MRQIRESLRLHLQAKLSYNEVGRTLKISKSVVGKYLSLARVAGVDWSVAQTLSDQELEAKLYKAALPRNNKQFLASNVDLAHGAFEAHGPLAVFDAKAGVFEGQWVVFGVLFPQQL